mgnify:CR=1 FL=1
MPDEGVGFEEFAKDLPKLEVTRTVRGSEIKTLYYLDTLITNGDKYSGGKFTPGDSACYGTDLVAAYNKRVENAIKSYAEKGYSISTIQNILPDFVLSGGATVQVLNGSGTVKQYSKDEITNKIKTELIPILVKEYAETYAKQLCKRYEIKDQIKVTASF